MTTELSRIFLHLPFSFQTMLYTLLFQIHAGQSFAQSDFLQYIAPLNSIYLWDIYRYARFRLFHIHVD